MGFITGFFSKARYEVWYYYRCFRGVLALLILVLVWGFSILTSTDGYFMLLTAALSKPAKWLAKTKYVSPGMAEKLNDLGRYSKQLWASHDQFQNSKFNGNKDHTISGRIGYNAEQTNDPKWLTMEAIVNKVWVWIFNEENHCRIHIERDRVGQ